MNAVSKNADISNHSRVGITCIVVLNWNNAESTIDCLESIIPAIYESPATVVVCDNGSRTDDYRKLLLWCEAKTVRSELVNASTVAFVNTQLLRPDFVLIRIQENSGYAAGNNVGIRWAIAQGCYEYVWILNNDVIVAPGSLGNLVKEAVKDPTCAILGCTILDSDRKTVQCLAGYQFNPLLAITRSIHSERDVCRLLPSPHSYISGAAMFFRIDALRKVGGLCEDYFLYYEEQDIRRRLAALGYKIGWSRQSVVYHKGAVSTGGKTITNPTGSSRATYYGCLSLLLFVRNQMPCLLPWTFCSYIAIKSVYLVLTGRYQQVSSLSAAYCTFFTGRWKQRQTKNIDRVWYGYRTHISKLC